jgi:hypothetical protein
MGQVQPSEEIFRVVGIKYGERKVWRYRSKADALWRAKELDAHPRDELLEFSCAEVDWKPAPSSWLSASV